MVFARLGPQEKDAFFALLDEYFASRPEILAKANNNNHDAQTAMAVAASSAAASAARDAVVKHPEATAKFMSAGLKHLAATNSNNNTHNSSDNRTPVSGSGHAGTGELPEEETTTVAGRIAAAQAMFLASITPFRNTGTQIRKRLRVHRLRLRLPMVHLV